LDELVRRPAAIQGGIVGIHWSSFNALASVVEWVAAKRARLGCPGEGVQA
jgi:methylenetetrahydrofolate reductase (NADPH)